MNSEMVFNKMTLSFYGKDEQLFREQYFSDSISQFRVSFVFVIILYGVFGYLDSKLIPEYAYHFHLIRYAFVIPVLSLVLLASFTLFFQKCWQLLLLICFIIGGTGISIMTMMVPENYTYYGGMMLVFSAGYFFIKLRFFMATIAGWSTLLIFNLGALFFADIPNPILIGNNFFFIGTNMIGMFAAYNIEYYARRNFFLNQILDKEKLAIEENNKRLEFIVEERTNELLLAKEAAESNYANLQAIIEGTNNSIWAFNRNYEIRYINRVFQLEFQKVFGVWLEQGVNLIESLPEKTRGFWKSHYDKVLNNEQFTVENAVDTEDGLIYIQIVFNPILEKGEVVGGSCFGSNITHRKLEEMELNHAKELAIESDRLKSAFLANMSHEIRTPMNGILGFAELLRNPELSGDQQLMFIDIIEKSGIRMLNIINDIIDISKIESGLMKTSISETNINEQIEYIYTFFKPEVEAKGLSLTFRSSLPVKDSFIYTDREKVYAILTNLVKNAIKYTEQGAIEFGYTVGTTSLQFYVNDTGIGIPDDRQSAIFERFIQADIDDKMARSGAGLGLSISKAYTEMLGGEIWVESTVGQGSTFYFTLPYNVRQEESANPAGTTDKTGNSLSPKVTGLKVLIAEDDEVSELLLDIEVQAFSKDILKVKTGVEAVRLCRDNPDIDLILMDIRMPEMGGLSATRQIRQFNKDVIIIAQTAYSLAGDRERAIEAGCNDYISKPINKVELYSRIQQFFNS